jgi:hypothetical protein
MVPAPGALDTEGLDVSEGDMAELLRVDPEEWKVELPGRSTSTSPASATTCPRSCTSSSRSWRSGWAELAGSPGGGKRQLSSPPWDCAGRS